MALFKDFTFDGENSKDYGVYISGDAVYDAPERAMDMVQIPGRNGALALDNGYYKNIDVTYPAGCFAADQADFAAKLSRIRNMLASRHRYCRLEDAYHPDYFRMALYKSGLDVAPVARNKAGRFNIIFDAKPQRFLKSGEVVQELDADAPPTTSYGPADIVTFEGEPGDAIVHGQWPLEPVQDLHGYDSPWPAGGSAQLLPTDFTAETKNGITLKVNEDGSVTLNGTATATTTFSAPLSTYMWDGVEDCWLSGCPAGGNRDSTYSLRVDTDILGRYSAYDVGNGIWFDSILPGVDISNKPLCFTIVIRNGYPCNNLTFRPMLNKGLTAQPFCTYSNVCPISGWSGANVTNGADNLAAMFVDGSVPSVSTGQLVQANGARSGFIPITPSTAYIFDAATPFSAARYIFWYDANKHFISYNTDEHTVRATSPENAAFAMLRVSIVTNISQVLTRAFNAGTRASSSAPPVTIPVAWDAAGTVYGGTLQYLGGDAWRLTKTKQGVDLGSFSWAYANGKFYATSPADSPIGTPSGLLTPICSVYKNGYGHQVGFDRNTVDKEFLMNSTYIGSERLYIRDTAYSDVATFKTAVAGQTLVYPLATPVVYDLTGEELATLIGTNNIFSDTGTTTITVQSPYELENPTLYPSKPLIRVYGSGTIQVNDITITVAEHSGYIDIDCDMMDCHRGADSMNQYVSFSGNDFPELQPGINRILLNGPDKVEITPRWWEL